MLKPNNILSYFIRYIKANPKECALYKQINTTTTIEIFYNDKMIYHIRHYKLKKEISWNYKNNIIKDYNSGRIINYKIDYNKRLKYKAIYYKKDKKILRKNYNYILYEFIYNKYLIKRYFNYIIEDKDVLTINIIYYNGYKYFFKSGFDLKYNYINVCIMNKYELHYNTRFFNLFFVIRTYWDLLGIIRNY